MEWLKHVFSKKCERERHEKIKPPQVNNTLTDTICMDDHRAVKILNSIRFGLDKYKIIPASDQFISFSKLKSESNYSVMMGRFQRTIPAQSKIYTYKIVLFESVLKHAEWYITEPENTEKIDFIFEKICVKNEQEKSQKIEIILKELEQ